MKRYISLVMAAVVLVVSLAVPSYAADDIASYINVLDYSGVNGTDSYFDYVSAGSNTFTFNLPFKVMASYVDIIFHTNDAVPSSVKYSYGSPAFPDTALTVVSLGNNYYRAYGDVSQTGKEYIALIFEFSGSSWISFDKFLYWENPNFVYPIEAYCDILAKDYTATIHYVPTDLINERIFETTDQYDELYLSLFLYSYEWKKYDYIEYTFLTDSSSINSINAYLGDQALPFEVSFIDNSNVSGTNFVVSIILDLTNVNRNTDEYPIVCVNGSVDFNTFCAVSMLSVVGAISSSVPDPDVFFLRSIWNSIVSGFSNLTSSLGAFFTDLGSSISSNFTNLSSWLSTHFSNLTNNIFSYFNTLFDWLSHHFNNVISYIAGYFDTLYNWLTYHFNSLYDWLTHHFTNLQSTVATWGQAIVDAINGDASDADEFKEQVDQSNKELNDMAAVMDSFTTPNIDSINVDVGSFVSPTDISSLTVPMGMLFESNLVVTCIMISLIMATVMFVLFGKR